MIAAKCRELKKPVKWYSIPKLFRYEKMQKGRLREFFQLNMDILGVEDVCADAELIAAAIDMLRNLGLSSGDFQVHISSRTLLEQLFLFVGVKQDELLKLYAILDKMNKVGEENFQLMIDEFFVNKSVAEKVKKILSVKTIDEILTINSELEPVKEIERLFGYLRNLGFADYVRFDISVVRGLAYYTGIVFEIFDKKRTMRAIAGGGRYDKLVELYGGQPTPAVGFAVGDVILCDLLKELDKLPEIKRSCDLFIVSFDKNYENLLKVAKKFRDANFSVQYPLKPGNFGKQMKQADEVGARIVLFAGSQEEKEGNYKIKIMKSGEEKIVSIDDAEEEIRGVESRKTI
jgi:histidyl-tRNA synthetase